MTDDLMTIGEMCTTFDVTPRALRFYEAKELIRPIREGQKRLYTRRDRARLKLILRGKRFGFSLEQMRQLLNLYDLGDGQLTQVREAVRVARARIAEMISERDVIDRAIFDLNHEIAIAEATIADRRTQSAA